jgi:hypothetical protein
LDPTLRLGPTSPTAAIWSLSVSFVDLVTVVLDIENLGDQIGPRGGSGRPTGDAQ